MLPKSVMYILAIAITSAIILGSLSVILPSSINMDVNKANFMSTSSILTTTYINKKDNDADLREGVGCAYLLTDKKVYMLGEEVNITLFNSCGFTISLRSAVPIIINDEYVRVVFSPISAQVIIEIPEGGRKSWIWPQIDNDGESISAGIYYIHVETVEKGIITTSIEITT